jgi:hypothetical protein
MNQALIEIDVETENGLQVPTADKLSVLDYLAYASNQVWPSGFDICLRVNGIEMKP